MNIEIWYNETMSPSDKDFFTAPGKYDAWCQIHKERDRNNPYVLGDKMVKIASYHYVHIGSFLAQEAAEWAYDFTHTDQEYRDKFQDTVYRPMNVGDVVVIHGLEVVSAVACATIGWQDISQQWNASSQPVPMVSKTISGLHLEPGDYFEAVDVNTDETVAEYKYIEAYDSPFGDPMHSCMLYPHQTYSDGHPVPAERVELIDKDRGPGKIVFRRTIIQ